MDQVRESSYILLRRLLAEIEIHGSIGKYTDDSDDDDQLDQGESFCIHGFGFLSIMLSASRWMMPVGFGSARPSP